MGSFRLHCSLQGLENKAWTFIDEIIMGDKQPLTNSRVTKLHCKYIITVTYELVESKFNLKILRQAQHDHNI
jgi:hypothetical protein